MKISSEIISPIVLLTYFAPECVPSFCYHLHHRDSPHFLYLPTSDQTSSRTTYRGGNHPLYYKSIKIEQALPTRGTLDSHASKKPKTHSTHTMSFFTPLTLLVQDVFVEQVQHLSGVRKKYRVRENSGSPRSPRRVSEDKILHRRPRGSGCSLCTRRFHISGEARRFRIGSSDLRRSGRK